MITTSTGTTLAGMEPSRTHMYIGMSPCGIGIRIFRTSTISMGMADIM